MARLPALLHPDPGRGLVICFGTGQTADTLRQDVRGPVDVVEVSAAVLALAPLFPANHRVLEDPRVEAIRMDGRAWLRRTDRRYDVITMEPMPPNFSGVNSLYSREFYEILARRLEPGGVVAQWLPIHLLSADHAVSIAATFRAAFPDALVWFDPVGEMAFLVGRRDAAPDPIGSDWPGIVRHGADRKLNAEQIRRNVLLNRDALARYAGGAALITDDNQLLQWSDMRAGGGGLRGERIRQRFRENRAAMLAARGAARPARSE